MKKKNVQIKEGAMDDLLIGRVRLKGGKAICLLENCKTRSSLVNRWKTVVWLAYLEILRIRTNL